MAQVAGIKTNTYANGSIKSITFDYKKYEKIVEPILKDLGVLSSEEEINDADFLEFEEAKTYTKKVYRKLCKK